MQKNDLGSELDTGGTLFEKLFVKNKRKKFPYKKYRKNKIKT